MLDVIGRRIRERAIDPENRELDFLPGLNAAIYDEPVRRVPTFDDAYIKGRSAAFYTFIGMPERALKLLDEAEALDPYLPVWCVEERGIAFYAQNRHREAVDHLCALPFQTRRSRLYQIAAWTALGEADRAQKLARCALAVQPDLDVKYVENQELYGESVRCRIRRMI